MARSAVIVSGSNAADKSTRFPNARLDQVDASMGQRVPTPLPGTAWDGTSFVGELPALRPPSSPLPSWLRLPVLGVKKPGRSGVSPSRGRLVSVREYGRSKNQVAADLGVSYGTQRQ